MKRNPLAIFFLILLAGLHAFVWRYSILPPNIPAYNGDQRVMTFLEELAVAQDEFKRQCYVDQDADGVGEYGSLSELVGEDIPRNPQARHAIVPGLIRYPRCGYAITVWLPGPDGPVNDRSLDGTPIKAGTPLDPREHQSTIDAQESHFLAYAQPHDIHSTGVGTYLINERGEVHCCGWQRKPMALALISASVASLAFLAILVTYSLIPLGKGRRRALVVSTCIWLIALFVGLVNGNNAVMTVYDQPYLSQYRADNDPSPDAAFRKGEKVFVGKVANHEKGNDDNIWWQLQWWDKIDPSF